MFMELRKRDLRPQKLCRSKLIIIIYHKSRSRQKIPIPGVPVYTKSAIFLPMKLKKKAQLLGRFELWGSGAGWWVGWLSGCFHQQRSAF